MNRLSNILLLALAVQLLLVAAVFWPRSDIGEAAANQLLLELDGNAIDRITIGGNDTSLLLSRTENGWSLPDYHSLPVDNQKMGAVLDDLPALQRGWPVANSSGARERFEVSEESFQRQVSWYGGEEELGRVYIGTSPGFRKVHARVGEEDPVFAVTFNTFDLPLQGADWLDKTLLQVTDVRAVTGLDYQLRRESDSWQSTDGTAPAAEEINSLISALEGLRVTSAADIATAGILQGMNAPATLTVATAGGTREFRLYEIEDAYYINRADIPVFFSLSQYDYDRLNQVNAATLFPAPQAADEAGAAPGEQSGEATPEAALEPGAG